MRIPRWAREKKNKTERTIKGKSERNLNGRVLSGLDVFCWRQHPRARGIQINWFRNDFNYETKTHWPLTHSMVDTHTTVRIRCHGKWDCNCEWKHLSVEMKMNVPFVRFAFFVPLFWLSFDFTITCHQKAGAGEKNPIRHAIAQMKNEFSMRRPFVRASEWALSSLNSSISLFGIGNSIGTGRVRQWGDAHCIQLARCRPHIGRL